MGLGAKSGMHWSDRMVMYLFVLTTRALGAQKKELKTISNNVFKSITARTPSIVKGNKSLSLVWSK